MSSPFITLQKVLPQHGLSRLVGNLAASETPWIKKLFINQFARAYDIDMAEAEQSSLDAYPSFNAFFTRALADGARPIASGEGEICCPADGAVSQLGNIDGDTLLQAKGHTYTLEALAGSLGQGFEGGTFCTIYLAPSDYHRVHQRWSMLHPI